MVGDYVPKNLGTLRQFGQNDKPDPSAATSAQGGDFDASGMGDGVLSLAQHNIVLKGKLHIHFAFRFSNGDPFGEHCAVFDLVGWENPFGGPERRARLAIRNSSWPCGRCVLFGACR